MNEMIRVIYYYFEAAIKKPVYFILPVMTVLFGGSIFIYDMPKIYYSEGLLSMEIQHMPSSIVNPTVANERLQLLEQRLLTRESLLALAGKFNLFPEARATLPKAKVVELVRNQLVLDTVVAEATAQYGGSATIRIGFNYEDPQTAAKVARELTDRIIGDHRRIRLARATEAVEFLEREVRNLNARMAEREAEWTRYLTANRGALPNRVAAVLVELQAKGQDLAALEQSISSLKAERSLLEGQLLLGIERSSLPSRARAQLAAVREEIAQKSTIYSPTHPELVALKQRAASLESQIGEENPDKDTIWTRNAGTSSLPETLALIAERVANTGIRENALNEQRQRLVNDIALLNASVARAPEVEAQVDAIRFEKESLSRSLQDLTSRYETARLGQRLEQSETASPIETIEAPDVPVYPTSSRRVVLAVMLGLAGLAGFAGTYLADSLKKTVRGAFDLEELLEGRPLVLIPEWAPKQAGLFQFWLGGKRTRQAI
jgi:uncharacterized protein involved in exopolysaccharide biosynthesis